MAKNLIELAKTEYDHLSSKANDSKESGDVYASACYLAFELGLENERKKAYFKARGAYQNQAKTSKQKAFKRFYQFQEDNLREILNRNCSHNRIYKNKIWGIDAEDSTPNNELEEQEVEFIKDLRKYINKEVLKRIGNQNKYISNMCGYKEDIWSEKINIDSRLNKIEKQVKISKELPNENLAPVRNALESFYSDIIDDSSTDEAINTRFKDNRWKKRFKRLEAITKISPSKEWIDGGINSNICNGSIDIIKGILDITKTKIGDIKLWYFAYGYRFCVPSLRDVKEKNEDFKRRLKNYKWIRENTKIKPCTGPEYLKKLYENLNAELDAAGKTYLVDFGITRQLGVPCTYPSEKFWFERIKMIEDATGVKFKRKKKRKS